MLGVLALLASSARAEAAPAKLPPIVRVSDMTNARALVSTIKRKLTALHYDAPQVVLRQFAAARVPIARATGTDRTDGSTSWAWAKFDSDDVTRAAHGMKQGRVTYGIDVDLHRTQKQLTSAEKGASVRPISELPLSPDGMRLGDGTVKDQAIAVYARKGLVHALTSEGKKAQSELWFKRDPRSQLLFVVEQGAKKTKRP